jgi:hypothetical protein
MCGHYEAVKAIHWGIHSHAAVRRLGSVTIGAAIAALAMPGAAAADPITAAVPTLPDAPARSRPITVSPAAFTASSDLDGLYVWLGPIGAAGYADAKWDSAFGGEAAIARVHERAPLALIGVDLGASRWTARNSGRMWVDGLLGTRVLGRMMGVSLGPILEISELAHARFGGSIGVWGFAGITPFARVGAVTDLGMFAELGVHIALPVLHR